MFLGILKKRPIANDILNMIPNGILQGLLVYGIILIMYEFIIKDKIDENLVDLVKKIYKSSESLFLEIRYLLYYGSDDKETLNHKINLIKKKVQDTAEKNDEANQHAMKIAMTLVYFYVGAFFFMIILIYILGGSVNWVGFLLGGFLTIVGASFEYYFVTEVLLKYHYIELQKLYRSAQKKIIDIMKVRLRYEGFSSEVTNYIFSGVKTDLDSK